VPGQNDSAIFDCLNCDVVGLATDEQSKLLSFLHYLSVNDGEAVLAEGNGTDEKG
jgi:hypothetical protein